MGRKTFSADEPTSLFKNTFTRFTAEPPKPKKIEEEEDPLDAYMKEIDS